MIDLKQGDCLELMKNIPDKSVDLILTDPPYGVITKSTHDLKGWQNKEIKWDLPINPLEIFSFANRILRPNGRLILFSSEPYTSRLITQQIPAIPFVQRGIWQKNNAGNVLGCRRNLISYFEDICIFNKSFPKHDYESSNPLRAYFLEEKKKCGEIDFRQILGNGMASHYFTNGCQFSFPTKENYLKLQTTGFFTKSWEELKRINDEWSEKHIEILNNTYPVAFNLWRGEKQKSNIFLYPKDTTSFHPTQKPVALLEDLIKTYSNKGDWVLDFTMGSGSTGVACVNTNRNFIGFELDEHYFEIAKKRIGEAQTALSSRGGISIPEKR